MRKSGWDTSPRFPLLLATGPAEAALRAQGSGAFASAAAGASWVARSGVASSPSACSVRRGRAAGCCG
eukprot:4620760-Pyramimonas_sp.AAC.1